jgi:hypothetical protein
MDNDQLFCIEPHRPAPAISTNDLTQSIIKYLKARGFYAVRINCFGIYDPKTGHWRKSATARGTADIHACIRGYHLSIEVKSGSDRQSSQQKETEWQVINAGGFYLIVNDFAQFHHWFNEFSQRK